MGTMTIERGYVTSVLLVCICATVSSQQPSLKEMARAEGGTAVAIVDLYTPAMDVPALTANAHLVVHARIVKQRTLLNKAETTVMTEYTLVPLRVPLARSAVPSATPGEQEIVVRRPGGTVIVDGLRLRTDVDVYPESEAALKTGEEALFFLVHDQDGGFYRPVAGPFSIFRVSAGKAKAFTTFVARHRGASSAPLSDLLATVEKLGASGVRR
jgi:hypothetical protein